MGCLVARFGWRGQKTPKFENFGLKVFPLGTRGEPHMRPRGEPRWDLAASRTDKLFNFRCFLAHLTKTSYPKYFGLGDRNIFVVGSLSKLTDSTCFILSI